MNSEESGLISQGKIARTLPAAGEFNEILRKELTFSRDIHFDGACGSHSI